MLSVLFSPVVSLLSAVVSVKLRLQNEMQWHIPMCDLSLLRLWFGQLYSSELFYIRLIFCSLFVGLKVFLSNVQMVYEIKSKDTSASYSKKKMLQISWMCFKDLASKNIKTTF
jgi:hypothetical protein